MKPWRFSILYAVLLCVVSLAIPVSAADLETIKNVTLVENEWNDGDSFKVRADGKDLHLRLYFVDCLETTYGNKADDDRIKEQQNHFGLDEPGVVLRFGREAAAYVKQALAKPFTIHTGYAKALGRSASGRVYAFVETHDGDDLAHRLVELGLARVHGQTRPSPGGMESDLVIEELRDIRAMAMLKRSGIWAETNPDFLAERRKVQRDAKQARKAFRTKLKAYDAPTTANPINLNTASKKQLETISGIGPVLAAKIISNRPWRTVDDLLNVSGIGQNTLEKIRPYVTTGKPNATP